MSSTSLSKARTSAVVIRAPRIVTMLEETRAAEMTSSGSLGAGREIGWRNPEALTSLPTSDEHGNQINQSQQL
jgi:hypothetical protein